PPIIQPFIPDVSEPKPPLPPITPPNPELKAGLSGQGITEIPRATGSGNLDTASPGVLTFTGFNVSEVTTSVSSIDWSGGATPPTQAAALAGALSATIVNAGSGSGSIVLTFSAADNNFDFLAEGQTLTITYNVTATDNNGVSTQLVTITVIGTNDAPV